MNPWEILLVLHQSTPDCSVTTYSRASIRRGNWRCFAREKRGGRQVLETGVIRRRQANNPDPYPSTVGEFGSRCARADSNVGMAHQWARLIDKAGRDAIASQPVVPPSELSHFGPTSTLSR